MRYLFVFFPLLYFGCKIQNSIDSTDQNIISHSLSMVLDSQYLGYDINEKILVHFEMYPDRLKETSIKNYFESMEDLKSTKAIIVNDMLREVTYDSIKSIIFPIIVNNNIKIISDPGEGSSIFSDPSYFGTIGFSKVFFSDDKEMACHYLAINCDSSCSRGLLIFLVQQDGNWEVDEVVQLWGSNN